jgi:glucokinase
MSSRSRDRITPADVIAPESGLGLIGDIGATNTRFALVQANGKATPARVYALSDHASLADAIDCYLREEAPPVPPEEGVLAVASPVTGDQVTLTNHPWTFSVEELRQHLQLKRLRVVNDFAANAAAITQLSERDRVQIGGGAPIERTPIGVIGPGTGLGIGALVPTERGTIAIAGEGGHATMMPATAQESAILDLMRKRYDHVSAERVLSGPGLVNLYNTICELAQAPAAPFSPAQITSPRIWSKDPRTREAAAIFYAMLGSVAGNLALTMGARGGIYIAGGIVPRVPQFLAQSEFRQRFEAKGRLRGYLAAIPTYLIVRPLPALIGAAVLLRDTVEVV